MSRRIFELWALNIGVKPAAGARAVLQRVEKVEIYKSIRDVPGSLFLVIYFENAYFLKLYES